MNSSWRISPRPHGRSYWNYARRRMLHRPMAAMRLPRREEPVELAAMATDVTLDPAAAAGTPAPPPRNYEIVPKTAPDGADLGTELLEVAMGPHHPSTHGVFRMDVVLDGEVVVKLKPVFGYLHRNHEKIAENTSYL